MFADRLPEPPARDRAGSLFVSSSAAFRRLERLIDLVAPSPSPVLICGPSGSGKEIVAQLLHHRGRAPHAPFVDLNCGAIPENLVESELFGHAKGAFTGALSARPGLFAQARHGTLFLDEIGELPMSLQPKLLRVLETRSFRQVGASESSHFTGRIVAATHRDLLAMVKAGSFREDLYYRLAVLVLEVPGLDQRRDDIPGLIAHFAAAQERHLSFTPEALERLAQQPWHGHVRELRNFIERLAVLAETLLIDADTAAAFLPRQQAAGISLAALAEALLRLDGDDKLMAAQHLLIDFALCGADGNKTAAARTLGISRKAVERRLQSRNEPRLSAEACLKEGQALADCADFRKAIEVLTRGLLRLERRAPQEDGLRLRFHLRRLLALSHRAVGGWRSAEARACYAAALDDARALGEAAPLASLLFGVWTTQLMALELNEARATAQEMLELAQTGGDADALAHAYLALANTLFWLGDNREALACLGRGHLLDATPPAASQGLDLIGLAVMIEGLCAFQLGQFGRARAAGERLAARGASASAHPFHRAVALQGAAWLACLCEATERLGSLALALEQLCAQHGFVFYQGVGQFFRGCHLLHTGRADDGERAMAEGYERHMLCEGGLLFHSFHAWKRGEALLQAGRAADSERLVAAALEVALQRHERAYLGEMLGVLARARLAMGDLLGAERELRNALSSAVALGSAAGGLSVATHLAQLLADTGRRSEAKEVLLRALRGVEPDMGLPRLSQAMQLFRALEGPPFHVVSD